MRLNFISNDRGLHHIRFFEQHLLFLVAHNKNGIALPVRLQLYRYCR